jgi:predicted nucleic acid-binding protein
MLLDTDILIDLRRKLPAALFWLQSLPDPPAVCGFAALELLYGSWDLRELMGVRKLLRPMPVRWATEADLLRAMNHYPTLHLSAGIGMLDCLIAATAVGAGLPLATFNVRHYRPVPELITVRPYMR